MQSKNSKRPAVGRIYSFMRPYWLPFSITVCLYASQGFGFSYLSALLVNWITEAMLRADTGDILRAMGMYAALLVAYMLLLMVSVPMYTRYEETALRSLKTALFRSYIKTSVESGAHSGEGIAAMNTEADTAGELYGNTLAAVLSCFISVVFSAAVIFAVDWRLGLVAIAVGIVSFIIQTRFAGPLGRIAEKRLETNAEAVKDVSNLLSGAVTLRAFSLQQTMLVTYDRKNTSLLRLSYKQALIGMGQNIFSTVQGWLTLSGVFAVGGMLVASGSLSFPVLMMIPELCVVLASGMSQIGEAWAGLQGSVTASQRIVRVLKEGNRIAEIAAQKETFGSEWNGDYTLTAENASFTYMGADKPTLEDINLVIPENKMVALVGKSGSGKSTLLRTIIGLYERQDLSIRLGNMDLRTTPAAIWRQKFAYVDQSCKLFDLSIAENIRLGRLDATQADVEAAAADALAHAFITELPKGYETGCGEKGAALSGGQKQRIAIARALVRKAPVLVFDEAASALDAQSERQVMETIGRLRGTHTVLLATHNLHYALDADYIVVMENGRIVQTGTHGTLVKGDGAYARLLRNGTDKE